MSDESVLQNHLAAIPLLTWTRLKRAFSLPVYRISAVIVVAVPVVAALCNLTEAKADAFPEWLGSIAKTMHLPSTLVLTYSAALLLVVSRIVYDFFCPKVIHDYPTFDDFRRAFGSPGIELLRYLREEKFTRELFGDGGYLPRKGLPRELAHLNVEDVQKELGQAGKDRTTPPEEVIRLGYEITVRGCEVTNWAALLAANVLLVIAVGVVGCVLMLQLWMVIEAAL